MCYHCEEKRENCGQQEPFTAETNPSEKYARLQNKVKTGVKILKATKIPVKAEVITEMLILILVFKAI